MARFAISDIHGCIKTLNALLDKIHLAKADTLFLLGDYIDRGKNSREVIEKILELKTAGYDVQCLLGNHEWLLLNAAYDMGTKANWLRHNGGFPTLESYAIVAEDYLNYIPEDHLRFFKSLNFYLELDDYYLVHAGFNFLTDDPFDDYQSMIWIRDWHKHVNTNLIGNKTIVHGHTPRSVESLYTEVGLGKKHVLDIDCGCVYKGKKLLGYLAALNMDTFRIISQENIED